MSDKQPRSFKTAGVTLLAFMLTYLVVDGVAFAIAGYSTGREAYFWLLLLMGFGDCKLFCVTVMVKCNQLDVLQIQS